MRCETCHGLGKLTYDEHPAPKPTQFGSVFPCPDCGGSGVAHCCDGLTSCNDTTGSYGDLDWPAPNHFDPSKRGFDPK